jgi:hypothetical protein
VTVLRLWLRRGARRLRAAGTVGLMWCRRWTRIRCGVVLVYHRVEPRQGFTVCEMACTPESDVLLLGRLDAQIDGRERFARRLAHISRHTSKAQWEQ